MNLFAHAIRSKGFGAFIRRIGSIGSRFGLSTDKTDRNLRAYLGTLSDFGCNATFPITAVVLQRHPEMIRRLSADGVEFAVHGYIHTDHRSLSALQQRTQMARALDVFRVAGVAVDGFRSPYLRSNDDTVSAARSLGFGYISNETISYDVLDRATIEPSRWADYQRALKLYSAFPSTQAIARPRMCGGLVEIPVTLPDDEILVDRLGFTDGQRIGKVWSDLVDVTYAAGDLLTLQLHPERGTACSEALAVALTAAQRKPRPVWVAQLRDIAAWWRRRATFQVRVEAVGFRRWRIAGLGDADALVLLKHLTCPGSSEWYGPYAALKGGEEGVVECERRPVIGVAPASQALQTLLREEGYVVCSDASPEECALYLDCRSALTLAEQAAILDEVERSPAPLVRIGRWPNGARSAISITGDIDAITLGDFVRRAWEVR